MTRIVWNESQRVGQWVCERTGGVYSAVDSTAIGLERGTDLIAGVLFDHYNGASIAMHVAADGPHWLNRAYLRGCFTYPFVQLGIKKIIGLVDSSNAAARRFDEHLGFVLEATIEDAAPHGDLLIYSMTRAQCRYIQGA
ncbi:RimJ/RimL family protein N-acetyltransferase [Caballeronia udeis]|uniref:RimJ/RimL family protein N-acetyltransferase n=1 Tax=Caballeronia udeis TaxID=1232866 RepID=A0ABW8MLS2_9BURK